MAFTGHWRQKPFPDCAENALRQVRGTYLTYLLAGLSVACFCAMLPARAPAANYALAEPCGLDRVDEQVTAAYIYDGDTIKLADGRKLRLVGIDTPELAHDFRPAQPLAKQARKALARLVPLHDRLYLRYDKTRQDAYHRTLAHLFLEDGTNVQREMLASGLARVLAIPPNVWQIECYLAAEATAQTAKRGLWALRRYQPVDAETLMPGEKGFRLVVGQVHRVAEDRNALWLHLTDRVVLQVPRADLPYFTDHFPTTFKKRRLLARGWLTPLGNDLRMTIRHPAALRLFD